MHVTIVMPSMTKIEVETNWFRSSTGFSGKIKPVYRSGNAVFGHDVKHGGGDFDHPQDAVSRASQLTGIDREHDESDSFFHYRGGQIDQGIF